jgi:hypothetical protein
MKPISKAQVQLAAKLKKVQETPVSFALYVAVHDFVEHIEATPALPKAIATYAKANKELNIPKKYDYLKQIYQGVEDIDLDSNADLGHDRYAVVKELTSIRNQDVSESNSFWKKREAVRKLAGEIHGAFVPSEV